MRARTSARTSVNTLSLFMCEHSVRARSAGPAVRTRTPARASVNAPLVLELVSLFGFSALLDPL